MANPGLEFMEALSPSTTEIDFLTEKINEESRSQNISSDAYPFGIFVREKVRKQRNEMLEMECRTQANDAELEAISRTSPSSSSSSTSELLSSSSPLPFQESSRRINPSGTNLGKGKPPSPEVEESIIVGGCNGSIVYGSIYTDQLWVDPLHRGKGIGKRLMEKVHELGRRKNCSFATVGTMDFQGAQPFYEKLGYEVEFERAGYANGAKMIYLKKLL